MHRILPIPRVASKKLINVVDNEGSSSNMNNDNHEIKMLTKNAELLTGDWVHESVPQASPASRSATISHSVREYPRE